MFLKSFNFFLLTKKFRRLTQKSMTNKKKNKEKTSWRLFKLRKKLILVKTMLSFKNNQMEQFNNPKTDWEKRVWLENKNLLRRIQSWKNTNINKSSKILTSLRLQILEVYHFQQNNLIASVRLYFCETLKTGKRQVIIRKKEGKSGCSRTEFPFFLTFLIFFSFVLF